MNWGTVIGGTLLISGGTWVGAAFMGHEMLACAERAWFSACGALAALVLVRFGVLATEHPQSRNRRAGER